MAKYLEERTFLSLLVKKDQPNKISDEFYQSCLNVIEVDRKAYLAIFRGATMTSQIEVLGMSLENIRQRRCKLERQARQGLKFVSLDRWHEICQGSIEKDPYIISLNCLAVEKLALQRLALLNRHMGIHSPESEFFIQFKIAKDQDNNRCVDLKALRDLRLVNIAINKVAAWEHVSTEFH